MRVGSDAFEAAVNAPNKSPRFTIELAFDEDNQTLRYFTSHADSAVPAGATVLARTIEGLSVLSQRIDPDEAVSKIGAITFGVVDRAVIVTDELAAQLLVGRSTRRQRVRVFEGYEGLAFADYNLIQTQIVDKITHKNGLYRFKCADVQRTMRKEIFRLKETTLTASVDDQTGTIPVVSTDGFELLAHGTSYSDAPGLTVGYVKIEDEVIRYTGTTPTAFTGCTRGALNTRPAAHDIDPGASADRRTKVTEYVYLEMPAPKLAYAILTGILHNQAGATLPDNWHLAIPTEFVRLSDYTGIGADLWDPLDDTRGFVVRFEGEEDTDGKAFVEEQLMILMGAFMPVYNDGALGLKRMSNILAGAAYVALLDESNVVDYGDLVHDFESLHNQITIDWNWEPAFERTTRSITLIDAASVVTHGLSEPFRLELRGLHGSRHSDVILKTRFDAFRDSYTGPPLRFTCTVKPHLSKLEVGDVVRAKLAVVRDFVAGGTLDRSARVHNVQVDKVTGRVRLHLFASSQAAGELAPTSDATVLTQAYYEARGVDLATVLTITGANPGHISANGDLPAGDYHYIGDLILDTGVTVTINGNVRLFVMGNFTRNGTIDGVGRGHPGAAAVVGPTSLTDHNPGTVGVLGVTEAGGGLASIEFGTGAAAHLQSTRGAQTIGRDLVVPAHNLVWDGVALAGLPADLRGSSGASGGNLRFKKITDTGDPDDNRVITETVTWAPGGAGGAGGAGLVIVCRGFSGGASGKIDLSGGIGAEGGSIDARAGTVFLRAGSGAGGAPGGIFIALDGALVSATGLTAADFLARQGKTPITGLPARSPSGTFGYRGGSHYSFFVGAGDGTTFALPDMSGSRGALRVQFVPANVAAEADPAATKLTPPGGLSLLSGTAELARVAGSVYARIRATVTESPDARVLAYELQFKESALSAWQGAPLLTAGQLEGLLGPVRSGVAHDVRVRALGAARLESIWVTVLGHVVVGKTAKPSNVAGLAFNDTFLSWDDIADLDERGYVVRHQPAADPEDWNTATPAHTAGFLTETRFDTRDLVGGLTRLLVRALDTSGNLSAVATSLVVDLRPPAPDVFTVRTQADGTREFDAATTNPPADLDEGGVAIRFAIGSSSDWDAMTPLHDGLLASFPFETNQLAAGTYKFAAKNVDSAGNASAAATFIAASLPDPRIPEFIEDRTEEPAWSGTKTDCHVDEATGWLVADGTDTWGTLPATWQDWTRWNVNPVSPISYEIEIDVGVVVPFAPLVTVVADGAVTIEESHSDDGVQFTPFEAVGPRLTTRVIRVRVTVAGAYPKIKNMRTVLGGNPVHEVVEDIDTSALTGEQRIGVGDIRIPLTKLFRIIKTGRLTLQSVGAGWTWELIDKTIDPGPRFKIYNAAGNLADALIDATIEGL